MAAIEAGASVGEVARAFEINPNMMHRWRQEFRQGPGNAFAGVAQRRWKEGPVAELERKIGQQALEMDFLKGCLQRIDEQRHLQAVSGKPLSLKDAKLMTKSDHLQSRRVRVRSPQESE